MINLDEYVYSVNDFGKKFIRLEDLPDIEYDIDTSGQFYTEYHRPYGEIVGETTSQYVCSYRPLFFIEGVDSPITRSLKIIKYENGEFGVHDDCKLYVFKNYNLALGFAKKWLYVLDEGYLIDHR